jgi:carbazole 1,9a-dioxygenase terminal dioxygenase component
VQEAKGIVWVWMGKMTPVPLEEDVPSVILREDTAVKFRHGMKYGNWRFHAENVGAGHAQVLHRGALWMAFRRTPAHPNTPGSKLVHDADGDWIIQTSQGATLLESYPGLGTWPRFHFWQRSGSRAGPVQGIAASGAALRLPGITRVTNAPMLGQIYYEWYTPVDEDHYIYFQVASAWPKGFPGRLWFGLTYYLWGKPTQLILFNNQDLSVVKQTTNFVKRHNGNIGYLTPLTKQDSLHIQWRQYADAWARGEGTEWLKQAPISSGQAGASAVQGQPASGAPAIAGGAEE